MGFGGGRRWFLGGGERGKRREAKGSATSKRERRRERWERRTLRRESRDGNDGWVWEGAGDGSKGVPGCWREEDNGDEGFGGLDEGEARREEKVSEPSTKAQSYRIRKAESQASSP